jgi:hypothetical protein
MKCCVPGLISTYIRIAGQHERTFNPFERSIERGHVVAQ